MYNQSDLKFVYHLCDVVRVKRIRNRNQSGGWQDGTVAFEVQTWQPEFSGTEPAQRWSESRCGGAHLYSLGEAAIVGVSQPALHSKFQERQGCIVRPCHEKQATKCGFQDLQ